MVLGAPGGVFGALGGVSGRSWVLLEASWRLLESSWRCLGSSFKGIGGSTTQHRPPKAIQDRFGDRFWIPVDLKIYAPVEARALILKKRRFRNRSRCRSQNRPRNEFLGVSWSVFGRSCGFCGRLKNTVEMEGFRTIGQDKGFKNASVSDPVPGAILEPK